MTLPEAIREFERGMICQTLDEFDQNQTHAARALGISRRQLIYKMEDHGLKPMPKSRIKS